MAYDVSMIPQSTDSDCNAYLLRNDREYILVDAPGKAVKTIKQLVEQDGKLKAVFLTHGHFDHISGLASIVNKTGAKVYIHKSDMPMLTDTKLSLADLLYPPGSFPVYSGKATPVNDGEIISIGGYSVRVFHAPGHTPGMTAFEVFSSGHIDKIIFTGDFIFENSIGSTSFPGSSPANMANSLQRFVKTYGDKDYKLYPGHGASTSVQRELRSNRYLR